MKKRPRMRVQKPKDESSNTLFNMAMGAGGAQQSLSRFKNPQSTNSIKTYNPFKDALDDLGADNF